MTNFYNSHEDSLSARLPEELSTVLGKKHELVPITELQRVSFGSKNSFLGELADLEKLIRDLPITLPVSGSYHLDLKGNELHIYDTEKGITAYEIIGSFARPTRIMHGEKAVVIEVGGHDKPYFIVLHNQPFKGGVHSSRVTSPWRSSQISNDTSSESHGGGGSGER